MGLQRAPDSIRADAEPELGRHADPPLFEQPERRNARRAVSCSQRESPVSCVHCSWERRNQPSAEGSSDWLVQIACESINADVTPPVIGTRQR